MCTNPSQIGIKCIINFRSVVLNHFLQQFQLLYAKFQRASFTREEGFPRFLNELRTKQIDKLI